MSTQNCCILSSKISSKFPITQVYTLWSINSPVFDNKIGMVNTVDSTYVSGTAIPNYPMGTKVFFKVFAINKY